ncbi:DUF6460 domain-containing protein [Parvularcula marina]|uniref:DUF6460 domain-containing protein n=1 Tax=Parvularcula marina TaxID=2292771 RepID=A0A371RGI9_9PROT|nr:DUF6460 domain-containing protein [Parvularcula marina]RFB04568.1 hypothetical protein DX908_04295 [Parvularcula marina]
MRKIDFSLILKLGVLSLIVGTVLAVMNFDPLRFWEGIWDALIDGVEFIFGRGLDGLMAAGRYTLLGAMVVIPIWLISTIFSRRKKSVSKVEKTDT